MLMATSVFIIAFLVALSVCSPTSIHFEAISQESCSHIFCLVKHVNLGNTVVCLFNLVLLVGFLSHLDYHTSV